MLSTAVGSLPRALPPWGQLTDCFYRMLLSFIESGLCCNLSLVFLIVPLSSMSSVHNLLLSSDHLMCLPHSVVLIGIPQGPVKADYRAMLSEFLTNSRAGHLGGSAVGHLPWAQVMILGFQIESRIGFPVGSLLLPLPMSLPLCVSLMTK